MLGRLTLNFFTSGAKSTATEDRRRLILLNAILGAGFLALSAASASAYFSRRNIPLAITDAVFAAFAVALLVFLRTHLRIRMVGVISCVLIFVLFNYLIVTGGDHNTGPLWAYLFPLFSFFLVGGKTAIWLNGAMFLAAAIPLLVPTFALAKYELAFAGRFLGSFAVLSSITYAFEYSRVDAQNKMNAAQKETNDIFNSLREGLFLVLKEGERYVVGTRFSPVTTGFLEELNLAGRDFIDILAHVKPDIDRHTTLQYLELYFSADLDETMLTELNPLKLVEGRLGLAFEFHRVHKQDFKTGATLGVESLMCAITDKTDELRLQRELAAQEHKQSQQMRLLLEILHANPALLGEFVASAMEYENEIAQALQNETGDRVALVNEIYRKVHSIKGDARALGLEYIGEIAHGIEDKLAALRKLPTIEGKDMYAVTIAFGGLHSHLGELKELLARIKSHAAISETTTQTPLTDQIYAVARQLNKSTEKNVAIDTTHFDEAAIPIELARRAREILTQLIRNSFAHGIEATSERAAQGKSAKGKITIATKVAAGVATLSYADDGRGLDADAIKRKAIAAGVVAESDAALLPQPKIFALIFKPGFSTTERADGDSGRGMGMDIVHNHVRAVGGRIRLATKIHNGVSFSFDFPLEKTTT